MSRAFRFFSESTKLLIAGLLSLLAPLRRRNRWQDTTVAKVVEPPALFEAINTARARQGEPPVFAPGPLVLAVTPPRKRKLPGSRRVKLLLVFVVALATVGGAMAYFTSVGQGSGTATSGTVTAITLSAGTPAGALYPGGTADVAISVSNPNPISLHIPSLELAPGGISSDKAGCDVAKVHFAQQDNGGSGWDAPAGGSTIAPSPMISMDADAANACQGATFAVHLQVGS